ncbi:hypothetical protein J6590_015566 [Homalodisca vitripennis]|nr:hypothetical protein J6590_015566 [Homalodisca vitripennis]
MTNKVLMTVTDLAVFCYSSKAPVDTMMEVKKICPKALRAENKMDLTTSDTAETADVVKKSAGLEIWVRVQVLFVNQSLLKSDLFMTCYMG